MDTVPFDPRLPSLIAAELGDPYDLAAYCGMHASDYDRIKDSLPFRTALAQAEKELSENGYSPEYAELLQLQEAQPSLIATMLQAYHNSRTTLDQRLKIVEQVDKMIARRRDRLNPKGAGLNTGGPKFAININLPGGGSIQLQSVGGDPSDLETDYEEIEHG